MQLDRDQRRLVRPVLDEPTVDPPGAVAGDAVQPRAVIRPEPREHRHVVRADEDVDRVELEHTEPPHEAAILVDARRPGRPRPAEALRRQRDPAGGGEGEMMRSIVHERGVPICRVVRMGAPRFAIRRLPVKRDRDAADQTSMEVSSLPVGRPVRRRIGRRLFAVAVLALAGLWLLLHQDVSYYKVTSGSMEPTLQIGQRVAAEGSHSPRVDDIVVFHPPAGARPIDPLCGSSDEGAGHPQACGIPVPRESSATYVKRVVAGPGDEVSIVNGDAVVNGVTEEGPLRRAVRKRSLGVQLPDPRDGARRRLLRPRGQPGFVRRQSLLGTGAGRLDHRNGRALLGPAHGLQAGPLIGPSRDPGR